MAHLFPLLDEAAHLFVDGRYREAVPLLERILKDDPYNLDSALRLATAESELGHDDKALAAFKRAQAIAPGSPDVDTYLALFYAKGKNWQLAEPLLDRVLAESPDRLPALEALELIRERQGRIDEAIRLRQKIYTMRIPTSAELVSLGQMAMEAGQTQVAIDAFERAHTDHDLELGVLYLAAGRLQDSRDALDRVPPSTPQYPMALFKRAQVSVLLHEGDAAARIASARNHADATTRPLIERERLFR
jgi:tetratricopeptide (TPR) repeat protein